MITDMITARFPRILGAVAAVAMLTGCAISTDEGYEDPEFADYEEDVNDPIEDVNRFVWEVNLGMDKLFLRPVAEMYRAALPDIMQDAVRDFLDNLRTPVILVNDLLQGEWNRAWTTTARFGINTTAGGLGFYDIASDWGFEQHDEDFGQTMGSWGVGEGPYLMLPLFGPSNPRDAAGRVVDFFLDPLNWYLPGQEWAGLNGFGSAGELAQTTRTMVDGVDRRARNIETLDAVEESSLDFYAAIRSLYRQRRQDEINNGKNTGQTNVPSISQAQATAAE